MNKFLIIFIIGLISIVVLRYLVCKGLDKCKVISDILKERMPDQTLKYSQGRVYLLMSIIAYFITIGLLTSKALRPNLGFDTSTIEMIIEALQWVILLFAAYAMSSKGVNVAKMMLNKTKSGLPQNVEQKIEDTAKNSNENIQQ